MRFKLAFLLAIVVGAAVWISAPAASNASGAPDPAFDSGCNCHGAASSTVQVALTGPTEYEAGKTYDLALRITGGPMPVPVVTQNQGGFAAKVDLGKFVAGTGTQLKFDGVGITHTTAGNDLRAWSFQWVAPAAAAGNASFRYWANAVNGDTTSQNDLWAKGNVLVVPPKTMPNATANTTKGPEEGTPFLTGVVAAAAFVLVAAVLPRRPDES
ncbi:MAG: hypothetical protein HYT80_01590 [Euryarchaeota archaeon]|nr:hypothetical protein [Euryarchaeota archaeon]